MVFAPFTGKTASADGWKQRTPPPRARLMGGAVVRPQTPLGGTVPSPSPSPLAHGGVASSRPDGERDGKGNSTAIVPAVASTRAAPAVPITPAAQRRTLRWNDTVGFRTIPNRCAIAAGLYARDLWWTQEELRCFKKDSRISAA